MYKNSGAKAYAQVGLESAVMSASPHQLVVMLFDGARSALIRAGILIQQGDIPGKGNALSKAINIIDNGLIAGLSREKGDPELVDNLEALYSYMVRRLIHANLHNDQQAITEVMALLENIADAWRQIGPNYHPSQDQYNGSTSVPG
ncbi:MAG: flagellar export chaperone FliS [Ewingella americana]|jgi:flagellar protein FliS|uniref:Flagellar secretion chaperone FliS n=2 Tax=Ewingella americana TaxID=41202 RepID=A0A085GFI3_EWIA3|nr:flagellar export chaperone FliS [Ewingella americana]MDN5680887.1 flagellar export chaperone FliS [Ewingella sp.]NWA43247.1 flagellar export chaperone FliS [Pseudomonas reactans]KAA8729613.1 flagellar export chaperone FliS [Ewingella americana]KFC82478.1 FliS family flagellar biosynthesis protein [Ewingella americana ATCC 33852]MCI1678655.1 flagellar export chaperone FliS [Ewingella americana]